MKHAYLFLGLMVLVGCSKTAQPTFDSGRYYMAGDTNCQNYLVNPSIGVITCLNKNGQITEQRRALTNQELYMYQTNQMIQAQRSDAMLAEISSNNAAMNAQTMNTIKSVRNNAGFY